MKKRNVGALRLLFGAGPYRAGASLTDGVLMDLARRGVPAPLVWGKGVGVARVSLGADGVWDVRAEGVDPAWARTVKNRACIANYRAEHL